MKRVTSLIFSNYSLFSITIFLSSFLLFQVQPLLGKHILPWYGGSSSVWVTALFFFMIALAVGYCYVLCLSWLRIKFQLLIHTGFATLVFFLVYAHTRIWPSGITPLPDQIVTLGADPTWSVFVTLAIAIGLPFVLLATTSSLLQLWYGRISGQEPFSLYSISNIGSLLGLLSYPVIFEPLLKTQTQGICWTFGLALYLGLLCSVMLITYKLTSDVKNIANLNNAIGKTSLSKFLVWVAVASVPVLVLLAGTTFMTTAVAPIPLLWVGPLVLYLLSFVWTFRQRPDLHLAEVNQSAVIVLGLLALVLFSVGAAPVLATVLVIHAALLAVFHWCHEYLFANRPQVEQLPLFYVALSLGGILGSSVIKISSLFILEIPIELTIIFVSSLLIISYKWFKQAPSFLPPHLKSNAKLYIACFSLLVCIVGTYQVYLFQQKTLDHERNFFGYKAVSEYEYKGNQIKALQHGLTSHGFQIIVDGIPQIEAVSYYATSSGVGKTIEYLHATRGDTALDVAVIGLGAGDLAAYCRPQDKYHFIEIDPQVVKLARQHFTYLDFCPQAEVSVADGRIALENIDNSDSGIKYDLIILDAYADDVVPVHLMTTEAVGLYKKLLKPDGVIAMNISSRYLDLLPVTASLAETNGLAARYLFDNNPSTTFAAASLWTIMTSEDSVFAHPVFTGFSGFAADQKRLNWTDTYSALLPIIKLW